MTRDMHLFGHPDSGHAYKVRLFMTVAGIVHDYTEVDIWAPRESRPEIFRRHARLQEVPLLLDGGEAFIQSDAILVHLATTLGQWGAQDAATMRRCLEWLFWEANRLGMCLPQLRAAQRFAGFELTDGAREWLERRCAQDLDALAGELEKSGAFVCGQDPSIADFSLCGYLFYRDEIELSVPAVVIDWLARIADLPGWQPPHDLLSTHARGAST